MNHKVLGTIQAPLLVAVALVCALAAPALANNPPVWVDCPDTMMSFSVEDLVII